jgi:glycosyltransferase involved in cell wall biosynthesis
VMNSASSSAGVEVTRFGLAPTSVGTTAITVVIATYNRVEGLSRLLGDLNAQDLDVPFDVVVVDDGGREPVAPSLAKLTCRFPLVSVRQPNGGPGRARHCGIEFANGEVVVIVDDDMHIPPSFLRAHLDCYQKGADVVLGRIVSPNDPTLPLFERFHTGALERFVEEYNSGQSRPEGIRLCTGNVSFRKSAYEAVGGFDLSLIRCEDRDLGLRFEVAGYAFAFSIDGWSEHQSDHEDIHVWRKRSRLFGELDTKISWKHPSLPVASPWAFFPKLPRVLHPFLIGAAIAPRIGSMVGLASYRLGERVERAGRPKAAMSLASLCYALEYFSGVGHAFDRPRTQKVVQSWRAFAAGRAQ